ncbi:MAG: hypothetical protein IJP23_05740 [Oscillospiraceae bacterium]|nr:hypothetical protein [Oscillospiraceae bacterium]
MEALNAIVFIPHTDAPGHESSVVKEELLFVPLGKWMADALVSAGVDQFFVVFKGEADETVKSYFPEDTRFIHSATDDPEVELHNFLSCQKSGSRTLVVTRPVFLSSEHSADIACARVNDPEKPIYRFAENKKISRSGLYIIATELLMAELRSGNGFDMPRALMEAGDPICEDAPIIENAWAVTRAAAIAKNHVCRKLVSSGVTVIDSAAAWISPDAQIGIGTVIYPNTVVEPGCVIGRNCVIGPNVHLKNACVNDGVKLSFASAESRTLDKNLCPGRIVDEPAPQIAPEPEKKRFFKCK